MIEILIGFDLNFEVGFVSVAVAGVGAGSEVGVGMLEMDSMAGIVLEVDENKMMKRILCSVGFEEIKLRLPWVIGFQDAMISGGGWDSRA